MSVILFSKGEVYKQLADAYEGLKHLRYFKTEEEDNRFYNSLRRLYFANVATFLCQYHDHTSLGEDELTAIDQFQELEGKDKCQSDLEDLSEFLQAWGSLRYNLTTNDGEEYRAQDAYNCINDLAIYFSGKVVSNLAKFER